MDDARTHLAGLVASYAETDKTGLQLPTKEAVLEVSIAH